MYSTNCFYLLPVFSIEVFFLLLIKKTLYIYYIYHIYNIYIYIIYVIYIIYNIIYNI